jgi:hypothetical protein
MPLNESIESIAQVNALKGTALEATALDATVKAYRKARAAAQEHAMLEEVGKKMRLAQLEEVGKKRLEDGTA